MTNNLDWIDKVDPRRVWGVLVMHGAVAESWFHEREMFVSGWRRDWNEYRFEGNLGFDGKIWRDTLCIGGERLPRLYVNCYQEDESRKRKKVIEATNNALTELLISLGLRKPA